MDDKQLTADYMLALNCFAAAVMQKNDKGAARFREELHMILDLQLNNIVNQMKRTNDGN